MSELIAIIPARGNSKGIKRKNLMPIAGKPMFLYACEAAAQVADRVFVTTEDREIAAVASAHGFAVLSRPPDLSADDVTVDAVVGWAAKQFPSGPLLVVQPTVPQVTPEMLTAMVEAGETGQGAVCMERLTTHLRRNDGRSNRQDMTAGEQVGVRYYPAGWMDYDKFTVFHRPAQSVIDIDTLGDLAAVRQEMERGEVVFHFLANGKVGAGHLYRCLALADELQHHHVMFAPHNDTEIWAIDMVADRGYGFWSPSAGDRGTVHIADILDTYMHLGGGPWVHLEDSGPGARYADLVINALYPHSGAPNEVGGAAYAVLRPEFLSLPPREPTDSAGIVLLAFGGTDPAQLSERVASILWRVAPELRVVLGPGAAPFDTDWAAPGRVTLLEEAQMALEMMNADLVITSAGRTVFEAAACGTPAIVLAQNTRETTHSHLGLDKGNLYLGLGALVTDEAILHAVETVLSNTILWHEMSRAGQASVDGLGARRIARLVDGMMSGT